MPDIIDVSDSILREAQRTRLFSDTSDISDEVSKTIVSGGKHVVKSLSQTLTISESLAALQQTKQRIIFNSLNITETLQGYKNDQELIPPEVPIIPQIPNLIGTREHRIRVPRRIPRAILIEATLTNTIVSALKLLAFSDGINNKAIAGIRLELNQNNLALSATKVLVDESKIIVQSALKMQPQPEIIKASLRLGLPLSSLNLTTAKLKLRPELQSIHALKAVNFERMHKLVKIMKIAMLAEL